MEQKINYQKNLDKLLEEIKESQKTPSLLLHSCCGPCSSYCLDYLKDYFNITVFYYNPNIFPEEEYDLRLSEQRRLIEEAYCLQERSSKDSDALLNMDKGQTELQATAVKVGLLTVPYDHQEFLDAAKGFEAEPEGGLRCEKCFELRLNKTAEIAKELGFDYFGTTLTVSPHKNAMLINKVGHEAEVSINSLTSSNSTDVFADQQATPATDVTDHLHSSDFPFWLESDFKKKNGYLRSIELSNEYHLYRQNYCGCEFARSL